MTNLPEIRRSLASYLTNPVVRIMVRTGVTPNIISWIGFFISAGAAALIILGYTFAAGFVVLAGGFFDLMDGALARRMNQSSKFGAFLDSVLDRLSEAVLMFALLVFYVGEQSVAGVLVVGAALIGSLLVSYLRARAEAIGLDCQVGIFTRSERVIILALGLLLSGIDYALFIALLVIAAFSFITVIQRMVYIWRNVRKLDNL